MQLPILFCIQENKIPCRLTILIYAPDSADKINIHYLTILMKRDQILVCSLLNENWPKINPNLQLIFGSDASMLQCLHSNYIFLKLESVNEAVHSRQNSLWQLMLLSHLHIDIHHYWLRHGDHY